MFKGVEVPEHSLVVRETVGTANANTLMCESDYSPCCNNTENGWFFDFFHPDGNIFPVNTGGGGWYQTRDTGVVRLHYNGGNSEGIFLCRIRVSATEVQTLYVGAYPSVNDNNGGGVNGDGESVFVANKGIVKPVNHSHIELTLCKGMYVACACLLRLQRASTRDLIPPPHTLCRYCHCGLHCWYTIHIDHWTRG